MMSLVAGMAVGADSIEDMALFAARWHRQCVQQRVCVVGVGRRTCGRLMHTAGCVDFTRWLRTVASQQVHRSSSPDGSGGIVWLVSWCRGPRQCVGCREEAARGGVPSVSPLRAGIDREWALPRSPPIETVFVLGQRDDVAEQSVGLVVDARGEVQRVRCGVERSGWEAQSPETGNGDRVPGRIA
jgi:hypothetical protein